MIKKIIKKLKNIIFPNHCIICNKIIDSSYFCIDDWNKLHFLSEPACNICFNPINNKNQNQQFLCAKCLQKKPKYYKALAVFAYNETSKDLISKFKYYDQIYLAKYFSYQMQKIITPFLQEIDYVTAVPLHRLKLIKRKYNQSAILARNIAKLINKKVILDLLIRTKNNLPQASLKKKDRARNVANVFFLNEKYKNIIKGKNILLIDDVITTESTINNCTKILLKNNVRRVYILAVAKTITY